MQSLEQQSKTINYLRFPLIVGVVLIHSTFFSQAEIDINKYPAYSYISYLFTYILASVAVPLFFFISGYLFFYTKNKIWNIQTYKNKLKKRVFSLLIPYLFWNLLVIGLYIVALQLFPNVLSGELFKIDDYNCWLNALLGRMPINYPFWFIRNLMILVCFGPLIYWGLKKLNALALLIIGGVWFFYKDFPGLFYFTFGAYFSVHNKLFLDYVKDYRKASLFIYLLIVVVELYFSYTEVSYMNYVHKLGVLIGGIAVVSNVAYYISKGIIETNKFLLQGTFFVFAYHGTFIDFLRKFILKFFSNSSDLTFVAFYLILPVFVITFGLFLHSLLNKFFPKTTALITGGR